MVFVTSGIRPALFRALRVAFGACTHTPCAAAPFTAVHPLKLFHFFDLNAVRFIGVWRCARCGQAKQSNETTTPFGDFIVYTAVRTPCTL